MRNIFVLQGIANCGKTETIKSVFEILKTNYPNANIKDNCSDTRDISKIISNINNYKIGIESQGDPNSRLEKSLRDFDDEKCDIIICASRTKGMTVNWINSYSSKYEIIFIKQIIDTTNAQKENNITMANFIVKQAGL
jgi:hypothetical protein